MKINDIDKFGNCIFCHRHLVKNVVIGGKVQGVLDPDASDSFFKLNTGSMLVVPICKPCKNNVDLNDINVQEKIWEEVNNGWNLEIEHMKRNPEMFPDHNEDKSKSLKDFYSTLKITGYEANHRVGK